MSDIKDDENVLENLEQDGSEVENTEFGRALAALARKLKESRMRKEEARTKRSPRGFTKPRVVSKTRKSRKKASLLAKQRRRNLPKQTYSKGEPN